jgi:hypothetical protein
MASLDAVYNGDVVLSFEHQHLTNKLPIDQ